MNSQPSGSMCAACRYALSDCSDHDFASMRRMAQIDKDGEQTIIVRCSKFERQLDYLADKAVPEDRA